MNISLHNIFLILTIIGAVNWGLIGLLDLNLVTKMTGGNLLIAKVIYVLVGIAGCITIYFYFIAPLQKL